MNNRWLVMGLVVSVIVNLVSVFALGTYWRKAAPPPKPKPPATEESPAADAKTGLDRLKARFELTDAQLDTLRVLHEYRGTNLRPMRDRVDELQKAILSQLQQPGFDDARVDRMLHDMLAARDSLETGALAVMLRLRNTLTPDQRNRLPELFAELQRAGQKDAGRRPEDAGRETRDAGR